MNRTGTASRRKHSDRTTVGHALALLPIALSPISTALAQDAGERTLEEIVVTAQKRAEDSQKVPISMQALTPQLLEQHQVQGLDDYVSLLPSVSFQSYGPGQSQLHFRGVTTGSDGHPYGALPTTGMYLDEIPITTIGSSPDLHIYDVARVEALAGPQGTLYGASSLAGTLRIITNKPDSSAMSGGYDAEVNKFTGGDYGSTFEGYLNLPISERAAIRMVGFYQRDGGYIDNVRGSRTYQRLHTLPDDSVASEPLIVDNSDVAEDDFNSVETVGGRLALGIDLNDSWTVTPSLVAQDQTFKGTSLYDPLAGDLEVHDFLRSTSSDKWYQAALTVEGRIGSWDVVYAGGHMDRDLDAFHDYSYYTVSVDEFEDANYFQNQDGSPLDPTQFLRETQNFKKQSHELRVSSPAGERFDVTLGAFYQRQTNDHRADFYIPGVSESLQADHWAVLDDAVWLNQARRVDRDTAVFGQANFHITSELTLTAGIRAFEYRNTLVGFSGHTGTVADVGCVTYTPDCISIDKVADGDGETHRLNLSWQVNPDAMVYATYSTGFRPGGINRPLGFAPYDPDELTNYEIGWKTTWLNGRLRLNGAVYHQEWEDLLYALPDGFFSVVSFVNAGDADIDGLELDVQYRIGGLTLSSGVAYNEAKLATDFCVMFDGLPDCSSGVLAPRDTRLPVQPKFKGTATARYDFALGASEVFWQVSALHQTDAASRLDVHENSLLGDTPSFTTVDASIGGQAGDYNLELYMHNVTDERGELSRNPECSFGACLTHPRVYITRPRLVGFKIGRRF